MVLSKLLDMVVTGNVPEVMVNGNGKWIHAFERDDDGVDYTVYGPDLKEIDGGVYDAEDLVTALKDLVVEYLGAETVLTVGCFDEVTYLAGI